MSKPAPAHPPAATNKWDGPQPAPKALFQLIHANFPQTRNDGIYNKRNIAGTNTPSLHAEGRALDIGLSASKPDEKLIGDQLFEAFIETAAEMGFQEIIWNRQIWSTTHRLFTRTLATTRIRGISMRGSRVKLASK